MNNIVNWEFYSSFHNKVTEEEFPAAEAAAEKAVRSVIGPVRWAGITADTFGFDVLKDTICETIDIIKENARSAAGHNLSSVSNDGYSESYALTAPEELEAQTQTRIRGMLSGTGMVGAY